MNVQNGQFAWNSPWWSENASLRPDEPVAKFGAPVVDGPAAPRRVEQPGSAQRGEMFRDRALGEAMAPLAFTMLTTATTGSYRLGGLMMAAFVLAEMLGAVPCGRLLDRIGAARGATLLLLCAGAGFAGLAFAAGAGAPPGALVTLVGVPGLLTGGLSGGLRTLLAGTVSDRLLPRAVAVDAMLVDGVLIGGPALVALLASAHWLLPLGVMAVAYAGSAVLVPRHAALAGSATGSGGRPPLPLRGAARWLACLFTIGLLLCGFIAGGSVLAADLGRSGLLGGAALVGVCTGPLLTVATVRLQRLLPESRRSEGFSLAFVVQSTGFGFGSLSIGLLPVRFAPLLGVLSAAVTCAMLIRRAGPVAGMSPASSYRGRSRAQGDTDDRRAARDHRRERA
jgi:hypothetical protein